MKKQESPGFSRGEQVNDPTTIAAATNNLLAVILCAATAVWATTSGEAVWLTVLLVVIGAANLLAAGLILRGEARR